ncbi:MAG TPA: 23S rRNA (uracil(1939)-C(5))-methyltransferase RlmD [Terriglobales bacterium]|nr:23S rRNA (uracil(1939)-C(5))-methyltransferase RlmD [Terriglobales bacterium]
MQLSVEKLVYGGDGLARLPSDERGPGKAVFLPFVLEGETIEASIVEQKRGFARGRVEKILQPSPQRVEPACPYFGRCGGCHYQHSSYEHQVEIKADILKETLRRTAKLELETEIKIHPSPPWNYRNRARLQVRTVPDFALGYYNFNSHEVLPVEQCPISSPLINRAISAFWRMGRERKMPDGIREIEFFVNAEDTELLIEVSCDPGTASTPIREWADAARSAMPEIVGIVADKTDAAAGKRAEPKRIATSGSGEINYRVEGVSYRVSAGSFFQINRYLINELVSIVRRQGGGDIALDLYAGVGLFSTFLSRSFAQVIAVEPSQTSHLDLLHNSPSNVKAVRAATADFLLSATGKLRPDLVVVDPPRNGLGETVVQSLVGLGAHRMTYISCDPATASRDLVGLLSAGYRIEQVHLVDLFPQTFHLESVFHLAQ